MDTIFHGWRRKAGVVTLGLALGLMAGWIRSREIEDEISVSRNECVAMIVSSDLYLGICWVESVSSAKRLRLNWTSHAIDRSKKVQWMDSPFSVIFIRYDLPTIPLTLLSAYLLFWKPRKRASLG